MEGMEMNQTRRLIGEGANSLKVKRSYRDYSIVDEGGNVLAHITFNRSETPITEVKIWSYWLDDVDNIKLPVLTPANTAIAYSILSKYFTPELSMKILEVAKRIFKRWGE
jgi:hypothetical protein